MATKLSTVVIMTAGKVDWTLQLPDGRRHAPGRIWQWDCEGEFRLLTPRGYLTRKRNRFVSSEEDFEHGITFLGTTAPRSHGTDTSIGEILEMSGLGHGWESSPSFDIHAGANLACFTKQAEDGPERQTMGDMRRLHGTPGLGKGKGDDDLVIVLWALKGVLPGGPPSAHQVLDFRKRHGREIENLSLASLRPGEEWNREMIFA